MKIAKAIALLLILAFAASCATIGNVRKVATGKALLSKPAVIVPFTNENGAIIVPVRVNGQKQPLNFMVDTGGLNAISPEAAQKLGITEGIRVVIQTVSGEIRDVPLGVANQIEIGTGVVHTGVAMTIYDLSELENQAGVKVDGLIGNNTLMRFEFTIDYQYNRMIFQLPYETTIETTIPEPGVFIMPFDISVKEGITPKFAGKLNKTVKERFTLDTGQLGHTFITHETAVYLGYLDRDPRLMVAELHGRPIGGYTGVYQQPLIGRLESLDLGAIHVGPHLFISAQAESNRIGYSVLKNFRITLNYEKRMAVFRQWQNIDPSMRKSTCWLAIGMKQGKYVISGLVNGSEAQRAGIAPFDIVNTVNGKPSDSLGLLKIQQILHDDSVETVTLGIQGKPSPISLKKVDLLNLKACILKMPEEIK